MQKRERESCPEQESVKNGWFLQTHEPHRCHTDSCDSELKNGAREREGEDTQDLLVVHIESRVGAIPYGKEGHEKHCGTGTRVESGS